MQAGQPILISKKSCLRVGVLLFVLAWAASGCQGLLGPALPTPFPPEYLPTVLALTQQSADPANGEDTTPLPATPTATPVDTPSPSATIEPLPSTAATGLPTLAALTPDTPQPSPSPTATPDIPYAEIEIRNLGPLSRVTSPLHLFTYLRPGAGGKVRFELLGEDRRLLYRNLRVLDFVPVGAWAVLTMDFDFEIAAIAEAGRLQISVDDEYGRIVALNSVPLILLSIGEADIVPPRDVLATIVIQQPRKKALIQGGKLLVSGFARPESDQPLQVRLLTTKGQEVGSRLVGVDIAPGEQYGTFAVEVPYNVSEPTLVLLVVTEGADNLTDVIHLSSREIMLSP